MAERRLSLIAVPSAVRRRGAARANNNLAAGAMSALGACARLHAPQCARWLSSSAVLGTKLWRMSQGLPVNKNAEGPLTDGPDYTFTDGRPTPLLQKQRKRMLQQQEYAETIVKLSGELDFAIKREQELIRAKKEERDNIIRNRLKPKGDSLLKKSSR